MVGASTERTIQTGYLCLIQFIIGITDTCFGPALHDLQCIYDVTPQKVSLFNPVLTIGKVIGVLLNIRIRGRANNYSIVAATTTTACCQMVVVPLVPTFWLAIMIYGGVGLALGFAMHASIVLYGEIGKENPAIVHLIKLGLAAGGFGGPLVISPFLSDSVQSANVTHPTDQQNNMTLTHGLSHNNNCTTITYGFLIVASLGIPVAVGYILMRNVLQDPTINPPEKQGGVEDETLNKNDVIFLLLMAIFMSICVPMIFVYGYFLPAFGTLCKLHESPKRMAYLTISYMACFMIGRFLGTLVSVVMNQKVLLSICTIGSLVLSISLVFISEIDYTWLFVGTSVLSVLGGPVFPACQSWSLNASKHTNILCGIACIGDMAGYCAMALLTGQLMTLVSIQMLNYIMVGVSLLQLLVLVLSYLTDRLGMKGKTKSGYSQIGKDKV